MRHQQILGMQGSRQGERTSVLDVLARRGSTNEDGIKTSRHLVEVVEIPDHPWFVGVQYHPEFKTKPLQPHPLFRDFIGAAIRRAT